MLSGTRWPSVGRGSNTARSSSPTNSRSSGPRSPRSRPVRRTTPSSPVPRRCRTPTRCSSSGPARRSGWPPRRTSWRPRRSSRHGSTNAPPRSRNTRTGRSRTCCASVPTLPNPRAPMSPVPASGQPWCRWPRCGVPVASDPSRSPATGWARSPRRSSPADSIWRKPPGSSWPGRTPSAPPGRTSQSTAWTSPLTACRFRSIRASGRSRSGSPWPRRTPGASRWTGPRCSRVRDPVSSTCRPMPSNGSATG